MKVYRMKKKEIPQNAMLNAYAVIGEVISIYRMKRFNQHCSKLRRIKEMKRYKQD